ncbi:MAG TPA: hypothetical protein VNB29_02675, partial [Chthoniobacterales bacterium]|nr:hypothetical protein [Chthoniobacterales bacterium]
MLFGDLEIGASIQGAGDDPIGTVWIERRGISPEIVERLRADFFKRILGGQGVLLCLLGLKIFGANAGKQTVGFVPAASIFGKFDKDVQSLAIIRFFPDGQGEITDGGWDAAEAFHDEAGSLGEGGFNREERRTDQINRKKRKTEKPISTAICDSLCGGA